jgi:cell division protein FtsA
MRKNIIIGLDIGSFNIHAIVAGIYQDTGRIEIITSYVAPSRGIRRGVVVEPQELVEALESVVAVINKKTDFSISNAYVTVSGSHIETKTSKGVIAISRADGEVSDEDIKRVAETAETFSMPKNREIIHVVPQDYAVDKEMGIENPKGMTGVRLELNALIIEAFKPHIKNLNECLEKAGIRNEGFVFSPLASAVACLSRRQKELGVVIVDFGGATTDIAIYEENLIRHSAVLPIGSNHITNDIAIAFKIPVDLAEALKVKFGSALEKTVSKTEKIDFKKFGIAEEKIDRTKLAKVIEARIKEIMELVNKELKSINREKMLPAGVVLVGGGAKLSHLVECAKEELGLPAQIGYPIDIEGLIDEVNSPSFAAAVGLIKWSKESHRKIPSFGKIEGSYGKILGKTKEFFKNLIP